MISQFMYAGCWRQHSLQSQALTSAVHNLLPHVRRLLGTAKAMQPPRARS